MTLERGLISWFSSQIGQLWEQPVITGYGSGVVSKLQQLGANSERHRSHSDFEPAWLAGTPFYVTLWSIQ